MNVFMRAFRLAGLAIDVKLQQLLSYVGCCIPAARYTGHVTFIITRTIRSYEKFLNHFIIIITNFNKNGLNIYFLNCMFLNCFVQ